MEQREDFSKYVTEKDLHVLDDPRESPSRRGTVLSRVKKARQRAIRNAVEKDMTADDRLKEQMATNQMLSRWVFKKNHSILLFKVTCLCVFVIVSPSVPNLCL